MRKDAKITQRKVKCPRALVPYGRTKDAKPGDLIVFEMENTDGTKNRHFGRVFGRLDAPAHEGSEVRGHLAVIAWSDDLHHAFERWVDPQTVVALSDAHEGAVIKHVLTAPATTASFQAMRQWQMEGALTERYFQQRS